MPSAPWISVARLWDDSAHVARRRRTGVQLQLVRTPIRIHLDRLERRGWAELASRKYQPTGIAGQRHRCAFSLFEECRNFLKRPLLLIGAPYYQSADMLLKVHARSAAVAVTIPPKLAYEVMGTTELSLLSSGKWHACENLVGAYLRPIVLGNVRGLLYVLDSEIIEVPRRGTIFLAYFGPRVNLCSLAQVAIRARRATGGPENPSFTTPLRRENHTALASQRPNMAVAVKQDTRLLSRNVNSTYSCNSPRKHILFADLFAGSGGLSLGFLSARNARYELCSAIDISPICITTLKNNLSEVEQKEDITGRVTGNAIRLSDLAKCQRIEQLIPLSQNGGRVDVVVGGPPCQPFSSARRRPAARAEARLVAAFGRAVELIEPTVFLLENVQGILWNDASGSSPARKLMKRMRKGGYRVAVRVLDAAWFGAPQHRSRAFIVGMHSRLGNRVDPEEAFPSPQYTGSSSSPYRTVADAIADLPQIPNGHSCLQMSTRTSGGSCGEWGSLYVFDHITSCHSQYVLDRFRRIKPGENWTAIREMMTNYAAKEKTHSNIYRRLEWEKPSVTLGHYRKSMLIHPSQDRGLSLREALRLQTFPDWYRLWGNEHCLSKGLDRKQQQLANAVPPVLARAVAERLVEFVK